MESLCRFYIYAQTHQLFSGDEEHTLVTLALVKEVVNSAHLKNHSLETLRLGSTYSALCTLTKLPHEL